MSEFRRDPVVGRWVIISTDRGRRPSDFKRESVEENQKSCPFCVGHEDMTPPEILSYRNTEHKEDTSEWSLRVIPNKFPALAVEGSLNRRADGMYDKMNGVGAHEVIIETPNHDKELYEHSAEHIESIIWAYRERIVDLKRDVRLEYILIFKNRGSEAGATLAHPHSQLIATPVVPRRITEEIRGAQAYFKFRGRCVSCDIIVEEISSAKRIVSENDDFIAFCPYASRFPFEIWILPKEHSTKFEDISKEGAKNLAAITKDVLVKLNGVLDNPPYNYVLHNAPLKEGNLPHFHWRIEIIPKLMHVAGFEWGTGFYINPTPPEEAAKFLREYE